MQKLACVLIILFIVFSQPSFSRQSVDIRVDATKSIGTLEPFWAGITFHPTEYLSTHWGEELVRQLGETGAARTFIRLYNQPENAIRIADDGTISYDWSEFDKRARLILSIGAKPLVVFFGMPLQLAKYSDALKKRNFGAIVSLSPPKDYAQWQELCADFTRHVLKEFGEDEVTQWYFRCWNEPDLKGFWHNADVEEYKKLYDHFAHAVKGVNPKVRIGGGGYSSTATYKNPDQVRVFLDHVAHGKNHVTGETGSPIDYISMHAYGGTSGHGGPGWDYPAVDYLLTIQKNYFQILDEYPKLKDLPLFLDEWGVSASGTKGMDQEPMTVTRNNEYGAAFYSTLIAKQIELQQTTGRRFGNMMICISGYERRRTRDFMGLRTLHTRNGFHKPIFNVYKLLNKLGSELVETEMSHSNPDVHAYATKEKSKIIILVTNFQNDQPLGQGESYPVSIQLNWDRDGAVKVNHWRIDKQHSNSYTEYVRLGSPEFPNPLEMEQIRQRMDLEMIDSQIRRVQNHTLQIDVQMPCNSVSLIEILPN